MNRIRFIWTDLKYNTKKYFQRLFRGYADSDLWSLDSFLAELLYKMMDKFIKVKRMGYHVIEDGMDDEEAEQKWEDVLKDILAGFKAAISLCQDDYIDDYVTGYRDEECNKTDGSTFIMHNWPILDYDGIKKKEEELKATFNKGMDLFKEYFFGLWD